MDILNSLFTSVFGMSVVFAGLVILIVIISLQSLLFSAAGRRKAAKTVAMPLPVAAEPAAFVAQPGFPSGPPELKLIGVDDRTAAMIMAIVCETNNCAPAELYFKSIRALDEVQGNTGERV